MICTGYSYNDSHLQKRSIVSDLPPVSGGGGGGGYVNVPIMLGYLYSSQPISADLMAIPGDGDKSDDDKKETCLERKWVLRLTQRMSVVVKVALQKQC